MLKTVADTTKESIVGLTTSTAFLTISFQDILNIFQLISITLAIVVAILTAYLTVLKIRKEKQK